MTKVVAATAVLTAHSDLGKEPQTVRVEQAMLKAVEECAERGVTDPVAVRKAMLEARDAIAG